MLGHACGLVYLARQAVMYLGRTWHADADAYWERACRQRQAAARLGEIARHLAEQTALLREIRNVLTSPASTPIADPGYPKPNRLNAELCAQWTAGPDDEGANPLYECASATCGCHDDPNYLARPEGV